MDKSKKEYYESWRDMLNAIFPAGIPSYQEWHNMSKIADIISIICRYNAASIDLTYFEIVLKGEACLDDNIIWADLNDIDNINFQPEKMVFLKNISGLYS